MRFLYFYQNQQIMIQDLKQLLQNPVTKRKPDILSKLIQILRQLTYFISVAQTAGNKTLYEYCKYIEMTNISAGCKIDQGEDFFVILEGKVLLRHKKNLSVINQFGRGNELKMPQQGFEYFTKQQCILIAIKWQNLRKIQQMQRIAIYNHKKRLQHLKKSSELTELTSSYQNFSLFKDLPFYDLLDIVFHTKLKFYKKGQIIYQSTQYPLYLYFLVKGQVRIKHSQESNQMFNKYSAIRKPSDALATSIIKSNQLFGIQQIIQDKIYSSEAVVVSTESRIGIIEADVFRQKINHRFTRKILEHITNLINVKKNLIQKMKLSKKEKKREYQQSLDMSKASVHLRKRMNSMINQQQPKQQTGYFRSKRKNLPYTSYLPAKLFHKHLNSPIKFNGVPQKLQLNLYGEDILNKPRILNKTTQKKSGSKIPDHKYVYERVIINKLQQYDSIDQNKFLQQTLQHSNGSGSTINFFKITKKVGIDNRKRASFSRQ